MNNIKLYWSRNASVSGMRDEAGAVLDDDVLCKVCSGGVKDEMGFVST